MKKCVEIEIDTDTGNIHVMECAPKEEMGESMESGMQGEMTQGEGMGEGKMQDFEDMDSALQFAAQLLAGETRQSAAQAKQSIMAGYKKAGNRPIMGGM